jgi:hypothetical protein
MSRRRCWLAGGDAKWGRGRLASASAMAVSACLMRSAVRSSSFSKTKAMNAITQADGNAHEIEVSLTLQAGCKSRRHRSFGDQKESKTDIR